MTIYMGSATVALETIATLIHKMQNISLTVPADHFYFTMKAIILL